MTQHVELDLHSEFLRADLFLATGQPIEAARILERVVAGESANEAVLELLARAYVGSAGAGQRLGAARPRPDAGAAEPLGGRGGASSAPHPVMRAV